MKVQVEDFKTKMVESARQGTEFEQAMSEVAAEKESIMVRLSNAEKELSAVDRDMAELLRDKNRRLADRASLEEK